jgi:chloramphenicol O-acetyltransferase type A
MKKIELSDPHRKKHFEMFNGMNHPHFNITARVEISSFLNILKIRNIPFTPAIVYVISRVANEIAAFRQRIRMNSIYEHESVHPSFAVTTEASDVFSFCYVPYVPDASKFINSALEQMKKMKTQPSLEDEDERDDYLFLSVLPWIHFTSIQHAMSYHPHDSVPRITWGKYQQEGEKIWMPLSVQVHHAIVDGRHVGSFFEQMQAYLDDGFLLKS